MKRIIFSTLHAGVKRGIKWIARGGSHAGTLASQLHFIKEHTEGISFSLKAFKGDIEMLTTPEYQVTITTNMKSIFL